MIVTSIVNAFVSLVLSLISLLPEFTVSEGFLSWVSVVYQKLTSLSLILPIGAFAFVFGTILLFYSIKLTLFIISWVLRKIPVASVS